MTNLTAKNNNGITNKTTEDKGENKMKSLLDMYKAKTVEVTEDAGYKYGIESMGKFTIEKQKGVKESIGSISIKVDKYIAMLQDLESARKAIAQFGFKEGYSDYTGLVSVESNTISEFLSEKTKSMVCFVSYELDKKCIAEFKGCKWTNENLTKYLLDMIMIGRLYQEKTIDYAKKMEVLEIQDSPMKHIRLMSQQNLAVNFDGGKIDVVLNTPVGKDIIVVDDVANKTRMNFADNYKELIEEGIMEDINKTSLPDDILEELSILRTSNELDPFIEMKTYYKDIVGGYFNTRVTAQEENDEGRISVASEEYKEDKIRISNMLRMATAYMTPEKRGSLTKFVSGRTKGNQLAENENRFYLNICTKEFALWLSKMGLADAPFTGYKLLVNKGYGEGEFVNFENGMAEKAILKTAFTGWAEIKEYEGDMYAAVELEDAIKVPDINNKIIVKVQQGFVNKYGADAVIKSFNIAKNCKFTATGGDYNINIECSDGKTRKVPYDLEKWFFNVLRDQEGIIMKAAKNQVRTASGNLIDSVYVSIDLNSIPEIKGIPLPKFDEEIGFDEVETSDEI